MPSAPLNSLRASLLATLAAAGILTAPSAARAQQKTFHLDRLEIPGAPQDGFAIFRPETPQRTEVYGQFAMGYSLDPLRTRNITTDKTVIRNSSLAVVQHQFTLYGSAGLQLLDRITLGLNFPVTLIQSGSNPVYGGTTIFGASKTTSVVTGGPAVDDLRLDARAVLARSVDRGSAVGAQFSFFVPSGNSSNFGGDGQAHGLLMVTGEKLLYPVTLVGNLGVHFRPRNSINDPVNESGLGISNELRFAVGAFLPIQDGKYRVGATLFGQTGIYKDSSVIGDTFFTGRNTPLEVDVEGRMRLGNLDQYWVGAMGGTALARGYGAPDLRVVLLAGIHVPILETDARSPDARRRDHWKSQQSEVDSDGDGIPDRLDACPLEPEDHLEPDPNDGCPSVKDADGDGIPDALDACPNEPGPANKDPKQNGCPIKDRDKDGIPDAVDACPDVPGRASANPKKNGCPILAEKSEEDGVIHIFKQVNFAYNSSVILPDSFALLQEIADIIKDDRSIKKVSIDGHTDNRGSADYNKRLSQQRCDSVVAWLKAHGVEGGRLEAHGHGLEKPKADNNTDEGRAKNRRVEFNIIDQDK